MKTLIKVKKSNILWNYASFGLSAGSNIFILPIVLHILPSEELGLWYVFLSVNSFITLLDFGFTPQIARSITYVLCGLKKIQKEGVINVSLDTETDYFAFKNIIDTSKFIYLILGIISLIILTFIATPYIFFISRDVSVVNLIFSWIIFALACFFNLYFYYYNAVFNGIGEFRYLSISTICSKICYIISVTICLFSGMGILGLSISYLINAVVYRICLNYFLYYKVDIGVILKKQKYKMEMELIKNNFFAMWHNAWREGLITLSKFFFNHANTILCSIFINLTQTASYALSVQITTFIYTIAGIFFTTIHPVLSQAHIYNENKKKIRLFSLAWTIYIISYFFLLLSFIIFKDIVFSLVQTSIKIDISMFLFISLFMFLQYNYSLFTSYISSSNRLPYVKAVVITSFLSVICSTIIVKVTTLGIWGLIIPPFIIQLCYNNWKWPSVVLKENTMNIFDMFIIGFNQIIDYIKKYIRVRSFL
jgi:O-antigen/teichoic acid export membrane protein